MRLLKRHRLARGLTLKQLASTVGVDKSTVQAWETGRNTPRPRHIPRLAEIFEIEAMEITRLISPERTPRPPVSAAPSPAMA